MSNTVRNIAIVGGISLTYYLVRRHFDAKSASERAQEILDATKPDPDATPPVDPSIARGTISPGIPQMESHSVSIDGKRSPYIAPPGKIMPGQAEPSVSIRKVQQVADAQARVNQIRAEAQEHAANVETVRREAEALPPHRNPDGSRLRTVGPMECGSLVAAGEFDAAKKAGCQSALCSKYVSDIESFSAQISQYREEIDSRRSSSGQPLAQWQVDRRVKQMKRVYAVYKRAQRRFNTECKG